jgi:tetratricopeptide (TPR) repeat protein
MFTTEPKWPDISNYVDWSFVNSFFDLSSEPDTMGLNDASEVSVPFESLEIAEMVDRLSLSLKSGDHAENIRAVTAVLRRFPDADSAYFLRGSAYLQIGSLEQSIADFTKAIELKANNVKYYNARIEAYQRLGYFDLANADRRKTIELQRTAEKLPGTD